MPENIKIAADITFNTKDAERQLSNLGNTVSKSVSTSKQVREMADSFNRMSTRDMDKPMARVVTNIRDAIKESAKWEGYLNNIYKEYESLQESAKSGVKLQSMSSSYKHLIDEQKEYQDEIRKTQELLARGTKTVPSSEGIKPWEAPRAVERALTPDEIAKEEQYLTSLQGKLQGVQTEMRNMEQRGDAFPGLTDSIESATIALNRTSEKIVGLISNFNNLSASAPQAASATEASLNGVYDAMSKMSGINMAQPVQANATAIEQSMQDVTQATTENVQQVQQQVEGIKQTVAQPVQAQIIDTSALQNQVAFLSGILTNLTSNVNTQMSALTQSVTNGFQSIAQQSASSTQTATGQITSQIAHLESAVQRAESATSRVGTSAKKSSRVAVVSFASITKAIQQVFSGAQKLGSAIGDRLRGSFSKLQKSVDKAFSQRTFKRGLTTILKYGFGVRSLYFAFRKLRAAVKEGLQNLVKYEKAIGTSKELTSTNHAINELRTSLLYLKNAWGAAFAPIINAVMPYLRMLIDGIASAGNAVARFIAVLTGQQNVIQAVKVSAGDYADSLDDAAKSAGGASSAQKKLNDRLAAFDDLNVLGKDNDTDGGGGGGSALDAYTPNPEDMFTVIDAYSDFADRLKDAFEQSGFFGIGRVISDSVSNWLENIDWDGVKQKANEVGTAIGDLFRGLFGNPDFWSNLGDAGAGIANALIYGLKGFLDSNRNVHYGQMIAEGLNNFFRNTNWSQAGINVHNLAGGILDNIADFFKTADTHAIAQAITDLLEGINLGDLVLKLGEVVVEAAKAVFEITGELIVNAGENLGESWWREFDMGKNYYSNEEDYKKLMKTAAIADGLEEQLSKGLPIASVADPFIKLFDYFKENPAQWAVDEITHRETMQRLKDSQREIYNTQMAWGALKQAEHDQIASGLSEMGYYGKLRDELKNIVDANGKVKEGYEQRVDFILTTFNEALGTEFTRTGDIIENYNGIINAIDLLIEKKRAEIILNAQEEAYTTAIMNRDQAIHNLAKAEQEYNAKLKEKNELQDKYNKALAFVEDIDARSLLPEFKISSEERKQYDEYMEFLDQNKEKLGLLEDEVDAAEAAYRRNQDAVAEYTDTIITYETNLQNFHDGLYDEMITSVVDYGDEFAAEEDRQKATLQAQIDDKQAYIDSLKRMQAEGYSYVTDEMIATEEAALAELQSSMEAYNRYVATGIDTVNATWDEGLDEQLSEISGKDIKFVETGTGLVQMFINGTAVGLPMAKEQMAVFASETVAALMQETIDENPQEVGKYVTTAVTDGINDPTEKATLNAAAAGLGAGIIVALKNELEVSSPSKKAKEVGEYFVEGVGEGVANQNKQSSVFSKIKSFGESLLGKLKNALQEKSPSKATEEMGLFLLEGLTQGIDKEAPNTLNTIAKFGNSVVDAFGGVADDVQSPMENMIEFVGGFIDILVEGISTLISKIGELASIQPTLSGFSRPSLPTIPMPSIAEGTVIPANSEFIKSIESQTLTGDEQYAMVKQAIAEVIANNGNAEVVRLLQQLIGVVESKELVIGDKDIGKANARYSAQQKLIRGTSF